LKDEKVGIVIAYGPGSEKTRLKRRVMGIMD
jgi:hypothetical protein